MRTPGRADLHNAGGQGLVPTARATRHAALTRQGNSAANVCYVLKTNATIVFLVICAFSCGQIRHRDAHVLKGLWTLIDELFTTERGRRQRLRKISENLQAKDKHLWNVGRIGKLQTGTNDGG